MNTAIYDVIIIGGGPAGLTAALYTGRKKLKTLVISIDIGGQINLTAHLENYPGVPLQAGTELMSAFHQQAEKFGAEFVSGKVAEVKKITKTNKKKKEITFNIKLTTGELYTTKSLIVATGKVPLQLNVPGEDKFIGRGISTCATCDAPFFKDKTVAVVGGGNSALEAALELTKFASKIYLIHRRQEFRGDAFTLEKVKAHPKIKPILDTIIKDIKGEKVIKSLLIENITTKKKEELPVHGLFLEIGYIPDGEIVQHLVKINEKKEIIADNGKTSCLGIFAAGDVTNTPFKQVVIAAGDGAKAALQAHLYLTGGTATLDWGKEK